MRMCPVCGTTYDVETGFCPMDGAGLMDSHQAGMLSTEEAAPQHRPGSQPTQPNHPPRPVQAAPPPAAAVGFHRPQPQPPSHRPAMQPAPIASARPVQAASAAAGAQALAAVASAYDHAHAKAHAQAPVLRQGDDLAGQTLEGRYRIESRIGIGGMGVVFKALQTTIEKPMAVKVLKSAHAADQQIAKRFSQEARLAGKIKHPNVVDIVDFGTAPNGSPYYVMEYLEGHSLAWQIDHKGRLDPPRAFEIAIQIARALSAAHRESIIHRDLKPDNIFLCPAPAGHGMQDLVKILDFGIARVEGRKTRLTAAGAVVGTPEYMSPEQSQASDTDHRTDLYALGIILFEMLVGRVPFKADTMVGTLTKQVFESAPKLHEAEPDLPMLPSTDDLIGRLLAKLAEDRPQTAVETIRLLEEAAERDLGDASPKSRKRATVAIGSWSVADNAGPAAVAANAQVGKGPLIAPPRNAPSFRVSSSMDGPLAAGAARARSLEGEQVERRKRPSVIAEGSKSRPPVTTSASPRPRGSSARGKAPSAKHRMLPLLLLGAGAAVFAAFMTVGLMRFFSAGDSAPNEDREAKDAGPEGAADEGESQAVAPTQAVQAPTPADEQSEPPPPAEPSPTVGGAGTHAPGAMDAAGDPKTVAATASKPAKKKKSKPREQPAAGSPGDSPDSGAPKPGDASGGEAPDKKVQDPPEPPSVSLGDLKDPFAEK